jgi:hypothetical protein
VKLRDKVVKVTIKEGQGYASGIWVTEDDDAECEGPTRKKARCNNTLTSTQECECGSRDHRRVLSKNCPWNGLSKKEIYKNYETRMKAVMAMETTATTAGCTVPTKDIVQNTSKFLAPMRTRKAATTNQKSCDTGFWNAMVCDTSTHVTLTHLVSFL